MTYSRVKRFLSSYFFLLLNSRKFGFVGKKCRIYSPFKIDGKKNIFIGNGTAIDYKTWLAALPLTGKQKCELKIGKGCEIGAFNHIFATESIIIEDNVLTAQNVYISDNIHRFSNLNKPIMQQGVIQKNKVIIGTGSWIGENVCIIGASIGKNCVIGANAVVTKNIPDYCVAVGVPAKVIKNLKSE